MDIEILRKKISCLICEYDGRNSYEHEKAKKELIDQIVNLLNQPRKDVMQC